MQWDPVWQLYKPIGGLPYDVRQRKVLDIAIDKVLGALSMHTAPQSIRAVVVSVGVTILLGLHNPPHSWTGTMGPSLPAFTMPLVLIPCCVVGQLGGLSLSFKIVPKSKVRICISYIYILVVSLLPRLGEPLVHSLVLWFLHVCVCYLPIT
jgi:hypothetical protein